MNRPHPYHLYQPFQQDMRHAKVPLPALEAQRHAVEAVDKVDRLIVLTEEKVRTLRELRETLLKNWTGRDPETGRQIK